jgi:hypothetical protein
VKQPDRDQLVAAIRQIHSERQGQALRIGVVDWAEILVAAARALGAAGYDSTSTNWIPIFGWLPGQAP